MLGSSEGREQSLGERAWGLSEGPAEKGRRVLPDQAAQVGRGQVIGQGPRRLTASFPTPSSCCHTCMKTISPRERNRNSEISNFKDVEEVGSGSRSRAPETDNQVVSVCFAKSSET